MTCHDITVHVFYGIPCVGKSTTAIKFACRQNIRTVIHTDYIREIQRGYVSSEQAPALFKVTHNAWRLYGLPTHQNVVAGFLEHVNDVAEAIRMVLGKLICDGFDAVIEGAHFHSGLIEELRVRDGVNIQATLITIGSANELRQRIHDKKAQRTRQAERKEWSENVSAMLTIQRYLVSDAHDHGIPIASGGDDWSNLWTPVQ